MSNKLWCGVDITAKDSSEFERYLRENYITFEPSSAYSMIHFECLMTKNELEATNEWLSLFRKENGYE